MTVVKSHINWIEATYTIKHVVLYLLVTFSLLTSLSMLWWHIRNMQSSNIQCRNNWYCLGLVHGALSDQPEVCLVHICPLVCVV